MIGCILVAALSALGIVCYLVSAYRYDKRQLIEEAERILEEAARR